MLSMNQGDTTKVFVTAPGFDLEATIRIACDYNGILVTVKPEDVLSQILLDQIRKENLD